MAQNELINFTIDQLRENKTSKLNLIKLNRYQ
jgi:hypothetical protein